MVSISFQIDCTIQMLMNMMSDKQKKYAKYAEQFQRASETVLVLKRIKESVDNIVPKMERLNNMLPPDERLEPFEMKEKRK